MGNIPTYEEACQLLGQYNREEFHLRHARVVAGVMGEFAREYDPGRIEFWTVVGLLHDLDFELHPDRHCVAVQEIMRGQNLDESLIHAVASHGFGITVEIEPEHIMEKILFATDELTGLIGAVALMRPSRSVTDLELKSVLKKFKTLNFAAGCSRDIIRQGAELLGWELETLIDRTIRAMRACDADHL